MIQTTNVSVRFSARVLYEGVNLKFTNGNCYGLIGANGAGKSTFLRVLSGDLQPDTGHVSVGPKETMYMLKQNHHEYDDQTVLKTVLMGNKQLIDIMDEKDELYAKEDFTEEDGIRAGDLEGLFAELDGWNADSNVAILLNGLNIDEELHEAQMSTLNNSDKVKVLLAQALFANPDTLLLDEPTNSLDIKAIAWLENFLINFENTVIVVSHDRHFLNKVCTHIADVDFGKIRIYAGNYDFWYESSQLITRQLNSQNKKKEDQIKELEEFIRRFSANASKSKQATSRKKTLDKITLDDISPSTRKYPFIDFKAERESGRSILEAKNVSCSIDGVEMFSNLSFTMRKNDKIVLLGDSVATNALLRCLSNEIEYTGTFEYGQTISQIFVPSDNTEYFNSDKSIVEWLTQYSKIDDLSYVRGFLGRMLFSGEEALKKVNVLSGGEKVRCMLSRAMMQAPNLLFLEDPTNHLDLETITSLNNGLINYKSEMIFTSHDHQFIQTIANRIIDLRGNTIIEKSTSYDDYLSSDYGIEI